MCPIRKQPELGMFDHGGKSQIDGVKRKILDLSEALLSSIQVSPTSAT